MPRSKRSDEKDCIFCKIVAGEIPARKRYEDDEIVIFEDIEPKAKIHLLCVPKEHYAYLSEADEICAIARQNAEKDCRPRAFARTRRRVSAGRQSG